MGDPLGHNYELLEPIGYRAFGRVWRARTRAGEIVAAKLLRPEYATDATVRTRFVREHTVLAATRHPNIVGVRDLVIEGDVLALVLEYVDGPSLRRLLAEQGALAPAEAARLVTEVCDGLAALHTAEILHRDVKPDNVLLQRGDDGLWHAKLGDFGLARVLRSSLTHTGAFTGTFEYAAPELAGGEPATAAADLYATGIVLYELLCGVTPFHAEHPVTVVLRHQSLPPPRLHGVPDRLSGVIRWLLAKQPAVRADLLLRGALHLHLAGAVVQRDDRDDPEPVQVEQLRRSLVHGSRPFGG
jgi:serine/threonine-protein kinase